MLKRPISNQILSLCAMAGACATSADAVLIHHWEFNEGTGAVAADSAGTETADIVGAVWATDSIQGTFLSFDGANDHVNPTLTLPLMDLTNDFTFATWANSQTIVDPNGGSQRNAIILGNRRDGAGIDFSPREFLKLTPRRYEFRAQDNGNTVAEYDDLPLDTWVHIAVVKDGTNIQAYYNGVAAGSLVITEGFTNALPFFIGGEPGQGGGEHFSGFIDDVRLYDNALSAAEVATLVPEPSTSVLGALAGCLLIARRKR